MTTVGDRVASKFAKGNDLKKMETQKPSKSDLYKLAQILIVLCTAKSIFVVHQVKCCIKTDTFSVVLIHYKKTQKISYGQALKRCITSGVFLLPTHLQMFIKRSLNKKVIVAQYLGHDFPHAGFFLSSTMCVCVWLQQSTAAELSA